MPTRWPVSNPGHDRLVLCPFMAGLDPAVAFWIGALAWHDANACLLAALPNCAITGPVIFAGVFCTDPFRRDADVFAALRAAGVLGVVNLPTVSMFDGEFGALLDVFNVGIAQELDFLRRARNAGFRVAACVPWGISAVHVAGLGAEFIIAHDGPPQPGRNDPADAAAARVRRQLPMEPPIISAATLLATVTE